MNKTERHLVHCIADTHNFKPELPGGDLLLIAGDGTMRGSKQEVKAFVSWLETLKYDKIIYIAGNHDVAIESYFSQDPRIEYLMHSSTVFEGWRIHGMPFSLFFEELNPAVAAFTVSEKSMAAFCEEIPKDTEILLIHGPPLGILDSIGEEQVGSEALLNAVMDRQALPHLKYVIFGHIHEQGECVDYVNDIAFVNCSQVDENYKLVYKPITIGLPRKPKGQNNDNGMA